jgi:hypothetical protein
MSCHGFDLLAMKKINLKRFLKVETLLMTSYRVKTAESSILISCEFYQNLPKSKSLVFTTFVLSS